MIDFVINLGFAPYGLGNNVVVSVLQLPYGQRCDAAGQAKGDLADL